MNKRYKLKEAFRLKTNCPYYLTSCNDCKEECEIRAIEWSYEHLREYIEEIENSNIFNML